MSDEREIKSARDVRVLMAEHDIPVKEFAKLVGVNYVTLSNVMHGKYKLSRPIRTRIEQLAKELDANPPVDPETEEEIPRRERFPRVRHM